MPNLIITNACQLRCPFCFASEYRVDAGSGAARHMSTEEFRRLLDFAPVKTVRFCGGEPTLHPQFGELLQLALAEPERRAFIMTNGLWPAEVRSQVAALPAEAMRRIDLLVNVLPSPAYRPEQRAQLDATIGLLDPQRVVLGFSIDRTPFEYEHLLDLANGHGLRRIRYSVAAPNIGDPTTWRLDPERDFASIAAQVVQLLAQAARRGVAVHSDCGYLPPCLFDERQRDDLFAGRDGHRLEFRCSGPVDIGPGGVAWRCYGLFSIVRGRADEWHCCAELDAHLAQRTTQLDDRPLYDRCADCEWRRDGTCGGGCYAYRVVRDLKQCAAARGIAIDDDAALLEAIAVVDAQRLRPAQRAGRPVWLLLEQGEWSELPLSALQTSLLNACDGQRTLTTIGAALASEGERAVVLSQVAQTARWLFARHSIDLRRL